MNASGDTAAGCSEAGQLKELLALHEAALDSMAHGLCMVDAEQRLVLFNQRFLEMYDLAPEAVRIGMPIARAAAAFRRARESLPPTQVEEIIPQAAST